MISPTDTWFHCPLPRPRCKYRLICLPHAGGSASFFRSWGTQLIDCEIYAVRYPGRAERIDEPLPKDLRKLALEIANAIVPFAEKPIALFGHSMGAAIALETARALEAQGIPIAHLFASGSRNGPCPPLSGQYEEDDDTICEQLIRLGGTDPEIISDPIFRELILPPVRGDAGMFHSYEMNLKPMLRCPVTTIFGNADMEADTRPWSKIAPECFSEKCVSGDHFYLIKTPPFSTIQEGLEKFRSTETPDPSSDGDQAYAIQAKYTV